MVIRLQPDDLMCGVDGCSSDKCCVQGTPPPPVEPPPPPRPLCSVGDAVVATWQGDGRQYRAEVAGMNPDGTVQVNWQDGDTTYPTVAAAQVFKNDLPCIGGPGGG